MKKNFDSTLTYSQLALLVITLTIASKSHAAGVIVLAGGGEEGAPGDKEAWSYNLYKTLIDNGDISGDKKIKVAILSYYPQKDSWYKDYFKSLGAHEVQAVVASTKDEANDPKIANELKNADVIFFRGGDQSEYYHNWKGTLLFKNIKEIDQKGGAIGGTSAGAMSLAGYALAGGQELGSKDVLQDAKTELLDDLKGGSSIHNDFLNIVPGTIIETHYGERARLGRALGVLAKASEDFSNKGLLSIAISEKTGVAIKGENALVYGNGTVEFIQETPETLNIRNSGSPLVYTDLRSDVLTEGWTYNIKNKKPDLEKLPLEVKKIELMKKCGQGALGLTIDGSKKSDSQLFELTPKYGLDNYQLYSNDNNKNILRGVIGITKANSYEEDPTGGSERAKIQASLFRAIYDEPNKTAIMLSEEGSLTIDDKLSEVIHFEKIPHLNIKESSSIVLNCSECTYKALSPRVTDLDNGSKTLRLPALINMKIHVLGESHKNMISYNLKTHQIQNNNLKLDIPPQQTCNIQKKDGIFSFKKDLEPLIDIISACEY